MNELPRGNELPLSQLPEAFPEPVRHEWRLMAEMRMQMPNVKAKELAVALGYNYFTILKWSRDPAYQRYENWLVKKTVDAIPPSMKPIKSVASTLNEYAHEMLESLIDIAEHTQDEKLAAQIAQDLLDRAGHAPRSRDTQRPFILNIGDNVARIFLDRGREAGLLPDGDIIDQSVG